MHRHVPQSARVVSNSRTPNVQKVGFCPESDPKEWDAASEKGLSGRFLASFRAIEIAVNQMLAERR
jgi:hypothetical protein